ncbi:MAG: SDR family NAD(P)-dependent oxidoreductase [Clostridia bacterium]|nr:SDR family NAD(P)-dependent oxidoreductase [Clostridia bacterium]
MGLNKVEYCLVTGASSGLGKEFVRQLAETKRYRIVAVARREDKLKELQDSFGDIVIPMKADVTSDEFSEGLEDLFGKYGFSIVINNAGFGLAGKFSDTDGKREQMMIDTNVKALQTVTKTAVRCMKDRGGHILNVASSAGYFPGGAYMATYYASKAYVLSLTNAVHEELRQEKSPLYIGSLCPGPVDTEFNDVANVKFSLKGITAEYCVRYALKKMFKGKREIIPTFRMKALIFLTRLAPRSMILKFTAGAQRSKIERR